jgi:hypothetical protein
MPGNNPANFDGIFALDHPENPLADYDMVVLPYCTGDVHIGGGERRYSYTGSDGQGRMVTTHHNGYENSMMVLDWIYDNYQAPEKVVVAGSSAGAIARHSIPVLLLNISKPHRWYCSRMRPVVTTAHSFR